LTEIKNLYLGLSTYPLVYLKGLSESCPIRWIFVISSTPVAVHRGGETGMLQKLSEDIRLCYRRAEDCARRAEIASNGALRAEFRSSEQTWLKLARSYELGQRLTLFIGENRKRRSEIDQRIGPLTGGDLPETAWVKSLKPSKAGNDQKHLQNEVVAIVDDHECVRWGLSALIESLGHRSAIFASAEEYLAADMTMSTACLILDVHLPRMSGPDLQALLVADAQCPPTVFVTGRFEEHVRRQVIEAGALGYFIKPCHEKALLDCLGMVLHIAA
jgi:CheY-like chemotaxis protein